VLGGIEKLKFFRKNEMTLWCKMDGAIKKRFHLTLDPEFLNAPEQSSGWSAKTAKHLKKRVANR
jgi:hypothetical protein